MKPSIAKAPIWLIYDGECPLCRFNARHVKVCKSLGQFNLINARDHHPIQTEINAAGLDINEGFIIKIEDTFYHGVDALHLLAFISSDSDRFNRISIFLFRKKWVTTLLYPILKSIRNILLWMKSK